MRPPVFDPTWSDEVQRVYAHDLQEIWDPAIAPHVWRMYHHQLDLYLGLVDSHQTLDILDVGCAQGTLALLLAERGHRVTALDIRRDFLEYAQTRHTHGEIRFVSGNVLELNYQGCFDVVFANQIVEHLVYPERLVDALRTALRPGGLLVMATPNAEYAKNHLPRYTELGNPATWEHRQFTADGDGHFFAYTRDELAAILRGCGMREVSGHFFETPWVSGHMKFRLFQPLLSARACRRLECWTLAVPWLGARLGHQLLMTARR